MRGGDGVFGSGSVLMVLWVVMGGVLVWVGDGVSVLPRRLLKTYLRLYQRYVKESCAAAHKGQSYCCAALW